MTELGGATRRLAAVWFADIVGFTSLASRDEDAAVNLVRLFQEAARATIEDHGGTLVKFTGDGVLAYASSTVTAVDTVLELMTAFRDRSRDDGNPVLLRAGVHVGDIVVAEDGDVYGDGVNIAARLEAEARPGQVMVSEDVWRQCRQRADLSFVSLGPQELKGIDEPVWAYELSATNDADLAPLRPITGDSGKRLEQARFVAVLPFETFGGGEDAEFLAMGLHNDLLTELSKVVELTVISRTSVLGYRGTDKPISRIARELNVGTVIEGSLQSAGTRVRLTVQVIDGLHDVHRWAESYDRELTTENLFDIQNDLVKHITESLHAELVPTKETAVPTANLDAYRLAAQGRQQFDQKTEEGFLRAIELFEQAVERDPEYATAWVGLADALALMEDYGYGESETLLARADEAVHRALALDPDSAAAHASLGLIHNTHQDGPASIRELEHAMRLQPSYADAHNWHSWVSLLIGRAEAGRDSAARAVELDPLSAEPIVNLSLGYSATGEPEKGAAEARRAREFSPFETADFYEGIALYEFRRFDEARTVLEPLAFRANDELSVPWAGYGPDATLALSLIELGEDDEARAVLATIDTDVDPFAAGLVHLALGDIDAAVTSFDLVEEMSPWPCLAVHHYYDDVWSRIAGKDARQAVLAKAYRSWKLEPPKKT